MSEVQTVEVVEVETVESTTVNNIGIPVETKATTMQAPAVPVATPTTFEDAKTLEQQLQLAQVIVDSRITPFKKAEAVVTAMMFANSLNMPATVALQHIHVIDGKATMSHTMIAALLEQAGVVIEWPEDYVRVSLGKNAKGQEVFTNRTTVKFIYRCPLRKKIVENTHSTTWQQFVQQELTTKGNWKKMPKQMMRARTLTEGARMYFSKLFMGLGYTTEEIVDANSLNDEVLYDENGTIIEINAEVQDSDVVSNVHKAKVSLSKEK